MVEVMYKNPWAVIIEVRIFAKEAFKEDWWRGEMMLIITPFIYLRSHNMSKTIRSHEKERLAFREY